MANIPRAVNKHEEETMAITEQSFCKITLFLIRDWDSFQIAMRGCLASPGNIMHKNTMQGWQG